MIFATIGTHHDPFPRAIDAALMLAGDAELVVQHGHTEPVAAGDNVRFYQWLRPDEVNVFFRDATVVITHAGVATIVGALRAGHHPIVIPRRKSFGEHVDDHQMQIVKALTRAGLITLLADESGRLRPGSTPRRSGASPTWPPPGLKMAIRSSVLGL